MGGGLSPHRVSPALSDGLVIGPDGTLMTRDGVVLKDQNLVVDADGTIRTRGKTYTDFVRNEDGSITLPDGTVLLAESHLAIHTWPEYRYAAVDVFSCGETLQPKVAVDYLLEQLGAARTSVVELQRGVFLQAPSPVFHKPVAVRG